MIKMAKKKAKTEAKLGVKAKAAGTSVKTYQQGINVEKEKMGAYSKKFGTTVKSLQADFKKHTKDLKEAALKMKEEGAKHMNTKINQFKGEMKAASKMMDDKVGKYKGDIKNQIKENKDAVAKMEGGVKFYLSEINKKKKDFQAYQEGPFKDYIKAFWG